MGGYVVYVAFLIVAQMSAEEMEQRKAEPIRQVLQACAQDAINQTAEVRLIPEYQPSEK